jgi:hypothetical protein
MAPSYLTLPLQQHRYRSASSHSLPASPKRWSSDAACTAAGATRAAAGGLLTRRPGRTRLARQPGATRTAAGRVSRGGRTQLARGVEAARTGLGAGSFTGRRWRKCSDFCRQFPDSDSACTPRSNDWWGGDRGLNRDKVSDTVSVGESF